MNSQDRSNWRLVLLGFCMGAAFVAWNSHGGNSVNAEPRRTTATEADQHFKSGGRLAEGVLQEILVVLKRIDDRLARFETGARLPSRGGPTQAAPANDLTPLRNEGFTVPEIKVRRPQ